MTRRKQTSKGGANSGGRGSQEGTAAVALACLGWRVVPIYGESEVNGERTCDCGDPNCSSHARHPCTPNGVADATSDEKRINEYWSRWPKAQVGIVTDLGAKPPLGGFVVIEATLTSGDREEKSEGHLAVASIMATALGPFVAPSEADRALGLPHCSVCHVIADDPTFEFMWSGDRPLFNLDDLCTHADRIRQHAQSGGRSSADGNPKGCPIPANFHEPVSKATRRVKSGHLAATRTSRRKAR
jgi:hypothetical protein